jgi:hypothetical protein
MSRRRLLVAMRDHLPQRLLAIAATVVAAQNENRSDTVARGAFPNGNEKPAGNDRGAEEQSDGRPCACSTGS